MEHEFPLYSTDHRLENRDHQRSPCLRAGSCFQEPSAGQFVTEAPKRPDPDLEI